MSVIVREYSFFSQNFLVNGNLGFNYKYQNLVSPLVS
jgi:hypothetical protein